MSNQSEFDPRFDPAFQPGFDGVTTLVPHAAAVRSIAPPPLVRVLDADPLEERDATDPAPQPTTPPELAAEESPRGSNPFLVALAFTAVACVVGGVILLTRLRELAAQLADSSNYEYVVLQALIIGSPILICLGLATGIGLLFALALRWRR